MTSRIAQVVVVGAGPAGAAAALFSARLGLDVVLLDKRTFPRDKICGDAIAQKSLGVLRELGLLDRVKLAPHEPISRAMLSSPGGHEIHVDLSSPEDAEPHLVCRREIFDEVLVRAARERLAVIEGAVVTDLVRDNGRVRGVTYRHGAVERTIRARVVVGADGFDSVVARRLGHYRHDSSRWFVATRGYYRGLDAAPRTVEVHFLTETLPGFLWIFPAGQGLANVGLGLVHRDLKRRGVRLRDVHEAVLKLPRLRARFARAERIGPLRGWNLPTPDTTRTLSGEGFLLAGDAAGLVDPFSGEGIGNALVSGRVAAESIAEALGERNRGRALERYPARLWTEIDGQEIALHYRLRSLARHGRVIDLLVGRAAAHTDVLDWLRAMTAAHGTVAKKRALFSPLAYARLAFKRGGRGSRF